MSQYIALPAYLPDQSPISGALTRAENVYAAADGYRPVGSVAALSNALPDDFAGGVSVISTTGTSTLLVGTKSQLVRFSDGSWPALASGLTVGRWHFAQFGDQVVAVNGVQTRVVDLALGTSAVLAGAPAGTSIAVVGDFVVIGEASGDLLKVQWSAFNDHSGWTPGVNQSGYQPMLTGGEVMGLAGGEIGIILQRQRIVRMERTGDADDAFNFAEVTPNIGCASKGSVVQAGRSIFFLSDRGFMALDDGQTIKPIGNEKVDRSFQAAVSRDEYEAIFAAIDPQNTLVMWCLPGNPGMIWCYNWVLDRWTTLRLPVKGIFSGFTASTTLEALDALYPSVDAVPFSLDDQRFSGGAPRLYAADGGNRIGTFTGPNLAVAIDQGFVALAEDQRARVQAVTPVGDMSDGVTLQLDCRMRLGDAAKPVTGVQLRRSGAVPVRASGRYVAARWQIAAGTEWSYFQGARFAFEAGGAR